MLKGDVFKNQIFENHVFALFINLFMNKADGIARNYKNAMNITYSGHNLTVSKGACIVQGRLLEEDSSTTIDAGIETMFCKLVVEVDLDKVNTGSVFNQGYYNIVKSASGYPELTQQDIAGQNSGKYQYELARFKISDGVVTDFEDKRTFIEDLLQYGGIDKLNIKIDNVRKKTLETKTFNTDNMNNITETGIYQVGNVQLDNAPPGFDNWYSVVVSKFSDIFIHQYAYKPSGSLFAIREYSGSPQVWGDWKLIPNDYLKNYLPKSGGYINGSLSVEKGLEVGNNTYLYNLDVAGNANIENIRANGFTLENDAYIGGYIKSPFTYSSTESSQVPNLVITSDGYIYRTTNTSSKRYKKDIKEIRNEELSPERLYNLKIKQFKYKKDYQPNEKDCRYNKDLIGFIAEDVAEVYPVAADIDEDGQVENWNERYLIPPMLALIQKQKIHQDEQDRLIEEKDKKINDLEDRIKALEEKVGVL